MKRYLLFTFYDYYPNGGWEDFAGSYDTIDEAVSAGINDPKDMYNIADSTTGELVNLPFN